MAKATTKEEREIKKLSANKFEIVESCTRRIDKKILSNQITELGELIAQKRRLSGIARLEDDLEAKVKLLEELNATK